MNDKNQPSNEVSEATLETVAGGSDIYEIISAELPGILYRTFLAYRARALADIPLDTREFNGVQAACRSALAHLMLIIKLRDKLSQHESRCHNAKEDHLSALISEAREQLYK